MKRLTIIACFMLGALAASAQDNAQETAYRRSSLYTMMMPDPALAGEAKAIVEGTFDTIPIPDKYNDHNLDVRTVDISGITVTEADIAAAVESSGDGGGKKKAGKALGKGLKAISAVRRHRQHLPRAVTRQWPSCSNTSMTTTWPTSSSPSGMA